MGLTSLPEPVNSNTIRWRRLLKDIYYTGQSVSPRGADSYELLGKSSVIDMNDPVIDTESRNINRAFLFGEAWWILSGSNRVRDITRYMKTIAKFSDDGTFFNGAYGPRVVSQLTYVVDTLRGDKDSRQAVMSIWERNPRPSKDIPCTLTLQFFIRDGKVHCVANMRSSDIWLGYVYDVFNFSMIARFIAIELGGYELGNLHMMIGSQHLYQRDATKAAAILDQPYQLIVDDEKPTLLHPGGFTSGIELIDELERRADLAKASKRSRLADKDAN